MPRDVDNAKSLLCLFIDASVVQSSSTKIWGLLFFEGTANEA